MKSTICIVQKYCFHPSYSLSLPLAGKVTSDVFLNDSGRVILDGQLPPDPESSEHPLDEEAGVELYLDVWEVTASQEAPYNSLDSDHCPANLQEPLSFQPSLHPTLDEGDPLHDGSVQSIIQQHLFCFPQEHLELTVRKIYKQTLKTRWHNNHNSPCRNLIIAVILTLLPFKATGLQSCCFRTYLCLADLIVLTVEVKTLQKLLDILLWGQQSSWQQDLVLLDELLQSTTSLMYHVNTNSSNVKMDFRLWVGYKRLQCVNIHITLIKAT